MAVDLDRLDELLSQQEAAIRRAFRQFLSSVESEAIQQAIMAKLESGDVGAAMAIVDSYVVRMGAVFAQINLAVGTFTALELAQLVQDAAPEVIGAISFDPSYPRAAEIVAAHRAQFVQQFTSQQRLATSQAIARSFREGDGPIETARAFRQSIGLTAHQEAIVDRYRKKLVNLDRTALQRELRNRRDDKIISRAIERNRPLTEKQIERNVAIYRRNMLQSRAETIARTEGLQAMNEARDESLDQMLEQTGLDPKRVIDMWNALRDKRTRDFHASMNGQKRPRGVPFVDGHGNKLRYPGDPRAPAETRINCRCQKTFSILPAA